MNRQIFTLLLFFVYISTTTQAQSDQGYLELKGSVKVERSPLPDAKISIYKDGVKLKTYSTDAKGKFVFRVDLNGQYEVVVSKQGYYSKKLYFNTTVPEDEVGIWNYKFVMTMIPEIEGFDASLLNQPIGRIMYVDKVADFDYDEDYTFAMLKKLEALMKEYEKARKEAYKRVIAQADAAFNKKDYDLAIELYDRAIDLDPYETYPDDQMYMIEKIIQQDLNADANYQKNIEKADGYYAQQDYTNARLYYKRALNYKDEQYPKDQIAKIEKMLNDQENLLAEKEAKEKAYATAIAAGDRFFESKQYQDALGKFTEASGIKPTEQYPKQKIAELKTILDQLANADKKKAELERAYADAISKADANFGQKKYTEALGFYKKANSLKPAESYPPAKITEIENLLASQRSLDEKYNGFIAVADKSFASKEYQNAKNTYQQALSIKPNEDYPQKKIAEIDAILLKLAQDKKNIDDKYNSLILLADGAFNKKEYDKAKQSYTQALAIKSNEAYPKEQINKINALLAEQANKKREYDMLISSADNNFNFKKWEDAKTDYEKALTIFPQEQYPQSRINEIENKLLAMKNAAEQKAARDKAYNEAITLADGLFTQKKYQESKNSYTKASSIKPSEQYPKQKIAEIDKILADKKALEDKYNSILATANKQFAAKQYKEAKVTYTSALQLKPDDAFPKQKIAEIDRLLGNMAALDSKYKSLIATADQQFAGKSYSEAKITYNKALQVKPNETHPKQRIAEIDRILSTMQALDTKYNNIIATADQQFASEQYKDAKVTYSNALQLKPNEEYPKKRIAEIDALLAQIAAKQEKQANDRKKYDGLISQADAQFANKQYQQSLMLYQEASDIMPNEQYPKQKIVEISNLLSSLAKRDKEYKDAVAQADQLYNAKSYEGSLAFYNKASGIKPEEQYPKQRIAEVNKMLSELKNKEEAYTGFIAKADVAFSNTQLENAKALYQSASQVKPEEKYPKERIEAINKLLAERASKAAEKERINKQYNALILSADAKYKSKNYNEAISDYSSASQLKPSESYPKEKISEINALLVKMKSQQQAYEAKMAEGKSLFQNKNYAGALAAYQQASNIKPNDQVAKQKIREVQAILDQIAQKDNQYRSLVTQADALFAQKNYSAAKPIYAQASGVKPQEAYPKSQIAKIDALLADQARKQKELQQQLAAYKSKIAEADALFSAKNYDNAISKYMDAKMIKGDESYPDEQIAKINKIINDNAAKLEADYKKAIAQGDNYKNSKSYDNAEMQYNLALQLKPGDAVAKARLSDLNNLRDRERLAQQKQAEIDAAYKSKIAEADALFSAKNYDNAISKYMDAKMIKGGESYPDEQIAKINKIINDNAAKLEADYKKAIAQGDNYKNSKSYDNAEMQYNLALQLKPGDAVAKARLAELKNLIERERLAQQKQAEIDAKYKKFITQADQAFKTKDYSTAIALYTNAKQVKPQERYPADRIDECKLKIQQQRAQADAEAEKERQAKLAAVQQANKNKDFDYTGEKRDRAFLNALAKQYPEGVTVENYEKPNKKIKRVIVNYDGIAKEYIEVKYSYGTFYFRNGQNISRTIFYSEIKERN